MKKKIILLSVLVVAALLTGCNSIGLQSSWKDRKIVIDGNDEDWKDQKYYIRDKNITVGVMNDERYLYLCFYPSNRKLSERLIKQGLTIWFNGDDKKKKDFGIKFPLGLKDGVKERSKRDLNYKEIEPKMIEKLMTDMFNKLEILDSNKNDEKIVEIKNLVGMEIALGVQKGVFVYELKIPYKYNQVYSATIGAEPGSKIYLNFETPEMDFEERSSQMDDRTGSMDQSMSGGKGGGNGSGRKGGSEKQTSSSLNAWVQIQLATQTLTE